MVKRLNKTYKPPPKLMNGKMTPLISSPREPKVESITIKQRVINSFFGANPKELVSPESRDNHLMMFDGKTSQSTTELNIKKLNKVYKNQGITKNKSIK